MRYIVLISFCSLAGFALNAHADLVIANNNPLGRFENGTFNLPTLKSPNDKYIINIKSADGKEQLMSLPSGATGLILGELAIPKLPWTWSFVLQEESPPSIKLITANQPKITWADLVSYKNSTLLEWVAAPSATTYKVSIAKKKKGTAEWEDDSDYVCTVEECYSPEKDRGFYVFTPSLGEHYRWRVSGLDDSKIVIAKSEYREFDIPNSQVQTIKDAGWSFQRSDTLSAADAGKPALFSYSANQKEAKDKTSAYSAEFAIIWTSPRYIFEDIFPRVSLEAKRNSSGDEKITDATRFRVGAYSAPKGFNWTASLKYEAERKTGTGKGLLELTATPVNTFLGTYQNIPSISINDRDSAGSIPIDRRPLLKIMPLLTFGAEIGKTFSTGTSAETESVVDRLRANLSFDIRWSQLEAKLGLPKIATYVDGTYWRLTKQSSSHHLTKAGVSIGLTDEVSFDIVYSVGEDSPDFTFTRSTNIGVGIKF